VTATKPLQTRSAFALLVPSEQPGEGRAEGTFLPPIVRSRKGAGVEFLPQSSVRVVQLREIRKASGDAKGADGQLFSALLALRTALAGKDGLALGSAKARMEQSRDTRQRQYEKEQFKRLESYGSTTSQVRAMFPKGIALPSDNAGVESKLLRIWPDTDSGATTWENISKLFAFAVSEVVDRSRLVLWWFKGEFRPAIYCEDIEVAVYVHAFLIAPTGELGFRSCPHCTEQFFQNRPNQEYCSPAHGNAHRAARSREKQKQEQLNGRKGNNGTDKTR
jgi:hypothetical protein